MHYSAKRSQITDIDEETTATDRGHKTQVDMQKSDYDF